MLLCTNFYCSSSNEARISILGSRIESVVCSETCVSLFVIPVNFVLTSASFMFLFLLYAMIGGLGNRNLSVSSFSSSAQYFRRHSLRSFVFMYGLYVVVKIRLFVVSLFVCLL